MSNITKSRTIKAVAAVAAGVVLLSATGGSFARWFDEQTEIGGPVESGTLSLSAPTLDSVTEATEGDLTLEGIEYEMVPGDVITALVTVTPTIVGDNMVATLTANEDASTGGLADWVDFDLTILGGATNALTEAESGTPIQAQLVMTMPFSTGGEPGVGNGIDGQTLTMTASDIVFSLVQNDRI